MPLGIIAKVFLLDGDATAPQLRGMNNTIKGNAYA
jgi:hypothetical protein